MQTHRERPPATALADFVSCVWLQRVTPGSEPYRHRTVPNGSAELVCELGAEPRIVGPQTGPVEEVLEPGATVVGVRFRPGAAPAVLGLPASELVDLSIDAAELWGSAAAALGELVATAADPAAALEAEVATRVSDNPDPIAAAAAAHLMPWRGHDVGSLTSALYVSERQLRRRFQTAVGFPPKVLQRMLRFQGFLALAQGAHDGRSTDLALLAAEAGYADQSHLTRESVRLAGSTPADLLRQAAHDCIGIHDHTASYGPLLAGRGAH